MVDGQLGNMLTNLYKKLGYIVARKILSQDEVNNLRTCLCHASGLDDSSYPTSWLKADISRCPDFYWLIKHRKILAVLREIYQTQPRWAVHSDLHVNLRPGQSQEYNWHRDNVYRKFGVGPDWSEDYMVTRVGIYLQASNQNRSPLCIKPGSHTNEEALKVDTFEPIPGDVVFFDCRAEHSAISPRSSKMALFLSYGMDNIHTARHAGYYRHIRKDLKYGDGPPSFKSMLKENDLLMQTPLVDTLDTQDGVLIRSGY